MGNAGICPRCGGKGTIWTGAARITCPRCGGSGIVGIRRVPSSPTHEPPK